MNPTPDPSLSLRPLEGRIRQVLEVLPASGPLGPAMKSLGEMENLKEVLDELRVLGASAPEPRIRFQAERILKAVRPPRGIDFGQPADLSRIRKALSSPDPELRVQAARALRKVEAPAAFPLALEAVRREEHPWVLSTLTSLIGLKGESHPEEALQCARRLLDHPSPRVSSNALLALLSLNPSEGVERARSRLEDQDPRLRTSAIMATYTSDPELAWAQVLTMLGSEEIWMRTSGSFLAAKLNHIDSERALLEALTREEDPSLILRTLDWFGRSGTEACLERLELIAHLGEKQFREAATRSLQQVQERLQSHAPPNRDLPSGVLESGFHLTGVIPSLAPCLPPGDSLDAPSSEDLLRSLVRQELTPPELEPAGVSPVLAEPSGTDFAARVRTLLLVVAALGVGLYLGFSRAPSASGELPEPTPSSLAEPAPPPSVRPLPTDRPTLVRLVAGKLDLNSLPPAGKRALWRGSLVSQEGRQLDLEVGDAIPLRLLLEEDLSPSLPPGTQVLVTGVVVRKSRQGVTLGPGVEVHVVPDAESDP